MQVDLKENLAKQVNGKKITEKSVIITARYLGKGWANNSGRIRTKI